MPNNPHSILHTPKAIAQKGPKDFSISNGKQKQKDDDDEVAKNFAIYRNSLQKSRST